MQIVMKQGAWGGASTPEQETVEFSWGAGLDRIDIRMKGKTFIELGKPKFLRVDLVPEVDTKGR